MATSIDQPFVGISPKRKFSSFSKCIFLFLSLVAILCSVASGSSNSFLTMKNPNNNICERALDRSSCLAVVSEVTPTISSKTNKVEILEMILQKTSSQIEETTALINNVHQRINNKREQKALENCVELMDMSLESVMDSIVALGNLTYSSHFDVHTSLSSVLTDHDTCMDMLHGQSLAIMKPILENLKSRASAALALIVSISPSNGDPEDCSTQSLSRTKSYISDYLHGQYPSWINPIDRKLLEASSSDINANVVVSKDGNGNYKTINEAIKNAPIKSNNRYVIHIKKGTYEEQVIIKSNKWNIMLIGDGREETIISYNLNFTAGTYNTPTLASEAINFIAQDLEIRNTAGVAGRQAVAYRSTGNYAVINRCKIAAYQDTLYVHNRLQFYKNTYITGTVDFIFGNGAAVLQNCQIVARKPGENQNNMITAQGKEDINQNTGISIQDCKITPSTDLKPVQHKFKTFLGRPWRPRSTVVVMQSYIDDHVDPAGWAPWSSTDDYSKTLYYGEYQNTGPGADTSNRVNWKGYHVITDSKVAENFTVGKFLCGGDWIAAAGVEFKKGL